MNNYVTKSELVSLLCKYANAEQIEIFDAIKIFEHPKTELANGLKINPCDLREVKWNMDSYIQDVYDPHCFNYVVLADASCEQSSTSACATSSICSF